jgi:hypothetical protein
MSCGRFFISGWLWTLKLFFMFSEAIDWFIKVPMVFTRCFRSKIVCKWVFWRMINDAFFVKTNKVLSFFLLSKSALNFKNIKALTQSLSWWATRQAHSTCPHSLLFFLIIFENNFCIYILISTLFFLFNLFLNNNNFLIKQKAFFSELHYV